MNGYNNPFQQEDPWAKAIRERRASGMIDQTAQDYATQARDFEAQQGRLSAQQAYARQLMDQAGQSPDLIRAGNVSVAGANPLSAMAQAIRGGTGAYLSMKTGEQQQALDAQEAAAQEAAGRAAWEQQQYERGIDQRDFGAGREDAANARADKLREIVSRETQAAEDRTATAALQTQKDEAATARGEAEIAAAKELQAQKDKAAYRRELVKAALQRQKDEAAAARDEAEIAAAKELQAQKDEAAYRRELVKAGVLPDEAVPDVKEATGLDKATEQAIDKLDSVAARNARTSLGAYKNLQDTIAEGNALLADGQTWKTTSELPAALATDLLGEKTGQWVRNFYKNKEFTDEQKRFIGNMANTIGGIRRVRTGANLTGIETILGEDWDPTAPGLGLDEMMQRAVALQKYMNNEFTDTYGLPPREVSDIWKPDEEDEFAGFSVEPGG